MSCVLFGPCASHVLFPRVLSHATNVLVYLKELGGGGDCPCMCRVMRPGIRAQRLSFVYVVPGKRRHCGCETLLPRLFGFLAVTVNGSQKRYK